jgi:hypothetical protein
MRPLRSSRRETTMKATLFALVGAAVFAVGLARPAMAQDPARAKSLFEFDGASGYSPGAGVVTDRRGTIFGTTTIGGNGPCYGGAGCGTVYALSPPLSDGGSWVFNKLYNFQGGQDGSAPSAPLTLAPDGTVYGYTTGGTFGTVFRLLPPTAPGNQWTFQILYVFTGQADGNLEAVYSPLVFRHGALFGIASGGSSACGQFGCGSVFRLRPRSGGGQWTLKTLFKFSGGAESGKPNWIVGPDGARPLYVSTSLGHGAVLEISPAGAGQWTETVITQFNGDGDGRNPSGLVLTSDGVLFGLAYGHHEGLVFQLTPPSPGIPEWTRSTIAAVSHNGWGPVSLAEGPMGSLIGAIEGDFDFFAGSVFQLTPPASGDTWNYAELWNFNRGPDRNPLNVVTGRGGNLFGVLQGGDSTNGSLFELH